MKRISLLLAATAIPALITGVAHAQTAQPRTLEEVIVTAERVVSNVQTTPIAITAFSGEELAKLQVTDVSHLAEYVPGLNVANHGFGGGAAILSIRGIGSTSLAGSPTVAFHVDGQYFALPRSLNSTFYDLERIEVLKGPQGTLYGRNSTAGVLNVITAKPTKDFSANLSGSYGNYNAVGLQGMINVPMSDMLSGRLAFNYNKHDGYQKAQFPGQRDVWDGNDLSLRGSLLFTPTDYLSFHFVTDLYREDNNGPGYQALNNLFVPAGHVDPFKNYFNAPTFKKQETQTYRLTTTWDAGPVTVTSLTAYIRDKLNSLVDQDGNFIQVGESRRIFPLEAFQQELRLAGNFGDRVEWQLGAYYYTEENQEIFNAAQDLIPTPGQPPVPPFIFITPAGVLDPNFDLILDNNLRTAETIAIFTHNKVKLTDALTLTLGGRYNRDENTQNRRQRGQAAVLNGAEFESTTWKVGLDWKPNDDLMVYGSVGTGFKSGGSNETPGLPDFDPEQILAYEVGVKSRLLDNRAQLNASAFYYDYTDLQVTVVANNASLTANAEGAEVYGAEMDGQFLVTDQLTFDVSAAYVHSEVGKLALACPLTAPPACPGIPGFFPTGGASIDVTGNPLSQAPEFSATIGLEYRIPMNSGDLTLRGNYSYQSEVLTQIYADVAPFTLMRQKGVGMVDATVRYEVEDKRWFAEAFVNNALDETKLVAGFVIPPTMIFGSYAPPRTFGVRLGYRWN